MANAITLVTKYLPVLDEAYRMSSRSAVLDTPPQFIRATREANKFQIATLTTAGLANYSRATGFQDGDVNLTWNEYQYQYDRGRSFQVDAMDNLESMSLAFGRLAGTFMRESVVPEIDATRFALYASKAGTKVTTAPTAATILDMLGTANATLDDAEVPDEGRVAFVSTKVFQMVTESPDITKYLDVEERTLQYAGKRVSTKLYYYNGLRIIKVPAKRFYDSIALDAGSTSSTGGYAPTPTTGKYIDFLVLHPSAVFQDMKHEIARIWAPNRAMVAGTDGVNPKADAWKFDYRVYHGAFAYTNKVKGIYVAASTVANAGG